MPEPADEDADDVAEEVDEDAAEDEDEAEADGRSLPQCSSSRSTRRVRCASLN